MDISTTIRRMEADDLRAVLTINETIRRNPSVATKPMLAARARINLVTVVPFGLAFQILFSAACSSPNAPEAAMRRVTIPIIVAQVPAVLLPASAIAV